MGDTDVLYVRPGSGGVAHVGEHAAAELRTEGRSVQEIVLDERGAPGLSALRLAVGQTRLIRSSRQVHVEMGRTTKAPFWFGVAAVLLRRDVALVVHDLPHIVRHPAAGLVPLGSRWRERLAYRVVAPLLDGSVKWLLMRLSGSVGVFSRQAEVDARRLGARRIVVLDHGGDAPIAGRAPSLGNAVLFCGFLSPDKGIEELLDAWASVSACTELPLVVAGEAAPEHRLWVDRQRRRGEALANRPVWLSRVDDARFHQLIADAAVVVLPYRASNPVSGVAIRAAIQGRPVVGTRVAALELSVEHGVTGLLGPVGDVDALAANIRSLLEDDVARDRMGALAAARASRLHTWRRHVRGLQQLHELAGRTS